MKRRDEVSAARLSLRDSFICSGPRRLPLKYGFFRLAVSSSSVRPRSIVLPCSSLRKMSSIGSVVFIPPALLFLPIFVIGHFFGRSFSPGIRLTCLPLLLLFP